MYKNSTVPLIWLYLSYSSWHVHDISTLPEVENNPASFADNDEASFHATTRNTSCSEDNLDNLESDSEVNLTHRFWSVQYDHNVCSNYKYTRKIFYISRREFHMNCFRQGDEWIWAVVYNWNDNNGGREGEGFKRVRVTSHGGGGGLGVGG